MQGCGYRAILLPTAGVTLPPGSNTADNARADVSARSIWNPLERAFLLEVEREVFTPLVFSTSGGMGEEAKTLFKRVAAKMANKTGQKYSETITFIRKRLRFDLLKTTVIALRGYRGKPSPSSSTEINELDLNIEPIP